MKIVADTNVLLRDALHDDLHQSRAAAKVLQSAELVAIPVAVFASSFGSCGKGYKKPAASGSLHSLAD